MADIDRDYAGDGADDGQGGKVYKTELDVLEAAERREDEKCEQHIDKPAYRALYKSVFRAFEADKRAEKHGYHLYRDIDGHYDLGGQGGKFYYHRKDKHKRKRYQHAYKRRP